MQLHGSSLDVTGARVSLPSCGGFTGCLYRDALNLKSSPSPTSAYTALLLPTYHPSSACVHHFGPVCAPAPGRHSTSASLPLGPLATANEPFQSSLPWSVKSTVGYWLLPAFQSWRSVLPNQTVICLLEVLVDESTAWSLNSGRDELHDILVIQLDNGEDIFFKVSGQYKESCFGSSIDTLMDQVQVKLRWSLLGKYFF